MLGFQPRAQRKANHHFANGGPVRGPGTGTSDDVPDSVPPGTYIAPADTVEAVGEEALAAMGGGPRGFKPAAARKVPVQLSNGEFKLPPEQVHAVGVQALDQLKDATHTPVARGFNPQHAKYEEPRQFFVDGGEVTREGNSYSGGNVSGPVTVNGQATGGTMSTVEGAAEAAKPTLSARGFSPAATAAPASQQSALGVIGMQSQQIRSAFAPPAVGAPALGFRPGAAAAPAAPVAPAAAPMPAAGTAQGFQPLGQRPATPAEQPRLGFQPQGYAEGGVVDEERRRVGAPGTPTNTWPGHVPARSPYAPASAPTARGFTPASQAQVRAVDNALAPPTAAGAVASANEAARRFTGDSMTSEQQNRVATNFNQEQSDRAAGAEAARRGEAPVYGISGSPTAAQVAAAPKPAQAPAPAAPALEPRGFQAGAGRGQVIPAPAAPAAAVTPAPVDESAARTAQMTRDAAHLRDMSQRSIAAAQAGEGGPTPGMGVIGPVDYANRNAAFNDEAALRTAAARGSWSPRRGFQADEGAIRAAAAPVQNRAQAVLEQGRQAAETQRAVVGFQTAAQRQAAEDARLDRRLTSEEARAAERTAIERERLEGENAARAPQIRAAERLERLQQQYETAPPEQRAAIAEQIRAFSGREGSQDWDLRVTPTTKNADGSTTQGSAIRINRRTGETQVVEGAQSAPIAQNSQAIAIRDNPSMSREQKIAALKALGY